MMLQKTKSIHPFDDNCLVKKKDNENDNECGRQKLKVWHLKIPKSVLFRHLMIHQFNIYDKFTKASIH